MKVRAYHLGKKFLLRDVLKKIRFVPRSRDPLVYTPSRGKHVVLLKYGVIVFFGFARDEEKHFIRTVEPFVIDKFETPFRENVTIVSGKTRDAVRSNSIHLQELGLEKVVLLSLVIGRSLALEYYEHEVEKVLGELEEVISSFAERGRTGLSARTLLKQVGFAMKVQHVTMRQIALLDKPDVTWEDAALDRLYGDVADYYEIEDRYVILEQKLDIIFRDAEFIVNLLQDNRSAMLEYIIIALIAFEIGIFIYEVFVR